MPPDLPPTLLTSHICRQTALSPEQANHLIAEVLAFYTETPVEFIRRRHFELQKSGLNNADIYQQLGEEILSRRFASEPLSERQIRRAIYG